tara:strand:+ start:45 stop:500 length:456 start_codon:yes stop_codon:yes gene_type:complete
MDFEINKQQLKGIFSSLKKHIVREMAEPIARKLGKSTAEIINTKGQIEIEGRFIASSVSIIGKTTPYDVGDSLSEQVEKEIVLTFVTRDDGKVCTICETFKAEHDTLSTANDKDMELLTNNNIFVELERQAFSLHKNCRCQVVRGVEKRAK